MSQHYHGHAHIHTASSSGQVADPHAHEHADPFFPNPNEIVVPEVAAAHTHAEANRAHYDANARNYDKIEMANELAGKSAAAMRRVWVFDEERTECLDYACGTGLLSRQLAPYCKSILGVDISQGMVDYYNERVSNQGIPASEMHAIRADLLTPPPAPELAHTTFDVVVCSQAYHHIHDLAGTTAALAALLRPGGALLVVDLLRSEQALHMHTRKDVPEHVRHTVAHKGGLEEDEVRTCFERAGLAEWAFEDALVKEVEGRVLKLFIAKGVKPREAEP
ncbi:S-adenosyl-L-methionine-dependent methyltransferase [Calocera cornea HHB12733]|uniref:S-adenosyl-L-methionine-dependent methyltransferase n=1 Tax=Calocera cornea HHB12733 TaxID=1353952 RepID=A0A165HTV8_9BASI|nr:S-adenosyl-L-methionine-dependent methyltransferase [Calocera cornea HHB12733]